MGVRRVWFSTLIYICCLPAAVSASALASTASTAQLWTALGGNVACGIAIHTPNTPPTQLLCSARSVPAPKAGVGFGDPGFVFLGSGTVKCPLDSTGPPLGLFSGSKFALRDAIRLEPGETALFLTDGVTESTTPDGH